MSDEPRSADELDPLTAVRGEWSRRTSLRDGTPVLLRQIRPDDRDRLAEGLRRLSPASRYQRFHADVDELTAEQLDYLTRVDHVDHEAIVAIDLERPEVPGIGVARYIRDPYERHVAEATVTVADDYHGKGAGTLLLGALSARAREHGVEVFRNFVLDSNQAMLEVFEQLGATRELESGGIWRVDLALPERESDLPDSPAGKAFMAAAKDGFRLSSLIPPIWSVTRRRPGTDAEPEDIPKAELASLRDELGGWLEDREHRTPTWPDRRDDRASDLEDRPTGDLDDGAGDDDR